MRNSETSNETTSLLSSTPTEPYKFTKRGKMEESTLSTSTTPGCDHGN
jgi:hypothetical protein